VIVNAYTGTNGAATGLTGTGSGSGGDPSSTTTNVHYSGGQYSTPSVQGSYFAGANPCLIGVGASGAGGPVGLSFTFGRNDEGCQRRSDAAAWHALGHDDVAIARMCQDDDNRAAFEAGGMVCPQDRAKPKPTASLQSVQQVAAISLPPAPVSAVPQVVAPVSVVQQVPARSRPDWCETVSGDAERQYYKTVCAF
jgi:hypothetical protein